MTDLRERVGMSAEENEAVVRRYIEECWNRHDIDATDELVSPEYLNHAASAGYRRAGARYSLNWVFPSSPTTASKSRTPSQAGTGWRCGARWSARTRASSWASRPRAGVSPPSRRTGSVLWAARWPSIGR